LVRQITLGGPPGGQAKVAKPWKRVFECDSLEGFGGFQSGFVAVSTHSAEFNSTTHGRKMTHIKKTSAPKKRKMNNCLGVRNTQLSFLALGD
jgi:hypothetical protein